jgi:integrase
MNVENLRKTYPILIEYLRENGYTKAYINEFLTDIGQVLREASDPHIKSYEEYYASLHTKFTKSTLHHKFKIIGKIKQFDLKGIFTTPVRRCGFLKPDNYRILSSEFKDVIDVYEKLAANRGVSVPYIRRLKLQAAKFFAYQQSLGAHTLSDVSERTVQSYFYDGEKIIRKVDVMKQIRYVLKECIPHYLNGECERIISLFPGMKKSHKTYPFLEKEELEKIQSVLLGNDDNNPNHLRNKAIVTITFYTGLRGCDIAELTFDDIDWEHNMINLIQAKTGVPLTLPLRPVVGNAIFDYIKQERPDSDSKTIFLTHDKKPRKLSNSALYHATVAVLNKAGVRTEGGKRGLHLFRHNLALTLLQNGIQTPVISGLLGHTSPVSIEHYLESDLIRLQECALSIEKYPVGKEVFGE